MTFDDVFHILEDVHENPGSYNGKHFIEVYGEKSYADFSRFALGKEPLARLDEDRLFLTDKGMARYFEMKGDRRRAWIETAMAIASSFVAAGTLVLGTGTILTFFLDESLGNMRFAYSIGLMFIFIVALVGVYNLIRKSMK